MTATITDGTANVSPTLWLTASQSFQSANKVHRLLSGRVAVTLGATAPRRGTLGLLFDSEAAKEACVTLHRSAALFHIADPDAPSLEMTYVLDDGGSVDVERLTDFDDAWLVRIDYQEVTE